MRAPGWLPVPLFWTFPLVVFAQPAPGPDEPPPTEWLGLHLSFWKAGSDVDSLGFGPHGRIALADRLDLRIQATFYPNFDETPGAPTSELRVIELAATLLWNFAGEEYYGIRRYGLAIPYIGVGAGGYSFDSDDPPGDSLDLDENVGYHACLGTHVHFTERIVMILEARRIWLKVKGNGVVGGSPTRIDDDLDGWIFTLGFEFGL